MGEAIAAGGDISIVSISDSGPTLTAMRDDGEDEGEAREVIGWRYDPGIAGLLRPLGAAEYEPLPPQTRQALQSAIMRYRWCTFERIRSQLPVLLRLLVRRRWSACHSGSVLAPLEYHSLEEYISSQQSDKRDGQDANRGRQRQRRRRGGGGGGGGEGGADGTYIPNFYSTKIIEFRRNGQNTFVEFSYRLAVKPFESVTITLSSSQFFNVEHMNSLRMTAKGTYPLMSVKELPAFLLQGILLSSLPIGSKAEEYEAFPEDRIAYLEMLCKAGGLLGLFPEAEANSLCVSLDAINHGIHAAIVTRNARALSLLLLLDECINRSRHQRAGTRQYDEGEANVFGSGKSIRTGHLIRAQHFRTAMRTSRYRDEQTPTIALFRILLHASAESLPFNDPEVVQFAMDVGGVFGRWLLELMLQLPRLVREQRGSVNPWKRCLFYMGKPISNSTIIRRYVEEVMIHGDKCVSPKGFLGIRNKTYMTAARWILTARGIRRNGRKALDSSLGDFAFSI